MSGLLQWFMENVRKQDYFAMKVTLTFKGEKAYKSFCGGVVTIVVFAAIIAQTIYQMHSCQKNPIYENYPPRYNYDYDETLTL